MQMHLARCIKTVPITNFQFTLEVSVLHLLTNIQHILYLQQRARNTANAVKLAQASDVEHTLLPQIAEMDYGEWEGQAIRAIGG